MRYLLTVSICWVALYAIYHLFLRKETFFHTNRAYLLGSLILGALIPCYQWLPVGWFVEEEVVTSYIMPIYQLQATVFVTAADAWTWVDALWGLYAVGVVVAMARLLHGVWRIYQLRDESVHEYISGVRIIWTARPHLPFSFGSAVYISDVVDLEIDVEQLIRHEQVHISSRHTIDVLIVEVLKVFFWFNPILILYKKALQQAHEYVADAMVIKDISRKSYGQLLLRQSQSGMEIALANHFFHSQIKKRIQMMYQQQSKRSAMVKYLSAIPVLAVLVVCFSAYYPSNTDDLEDKLYEIVTADISEEDRIYTLLGLLKEQEAKGAHMEEVASIMSHYGVDVVPDSEKDSYSMCRYFDRTAAKILEVHLARGIVVDTLPAKTLIMIEGEPFDGELEDLPFGTIHYTTRVRGEEASKKYGVPPNSEVIEVQLADRENQVLLSDKQLAFEPGMVVIVTRGEDPRILQNTQRSHPLLVVDGDIVVDDRALVRSDVPTGVAMMSILSRDEATAQYGENGKSGAIVLATKGLARSEAPSSAPTISEAPFGDGAYKKVDLMPAFPGCEELDRTSQELMTCSQEKMLQYIYTNVKYPAAAREAGEEGMTVVQFVIDHTGKVADAKIARDVGTHGLGAAAMDVIDQMRSEITWLPGREGGEPVNVMYTLPIRFALEEAATKAAKEEEQRPESPMQAVDVGDDVYKRVEFMPAFPGCEELDRTSQEFMTCSQEKMLQYIYSNVKYPAAAREAGEEGMTVVQFVIDQTGRVAEAKVVRDAGTHGLGAAAMDVIDQMRSEITWLPGIEDGKAVSVLYTLPIRFKLADDSDQTDEEATDDAGIALRPNPAQGAFFIDLKDIVGDVQVVVTDIAGRKIYEQSHSIAPDQTSLEISDSMFAAMSAVVSVINNKTTYNQKIVFE